MKKSLSQLYLAFIFLLFSFNSGATDVGFSEGNDPEKSGKLFWKVGANDYAQLSAMCQSIYEDNISSRPVNKHMSIRIDLHGKSVEDARKTVIDLIQKCHASREMTSIHFITGHGKHKNSKGKHGTILKNFSEWLKEDAIAPLIKDCHSTLGAFDVILNSNDASESLEGGEKVLKTTFIELIANHGDAFGQYVLGKMYLNGDRVNRDEKLAAYWLRKSADQGCDDAQLLFGYLCAMGKGTQHNLQVALSYYHKSAAQGNAGAMINIATMHFIGKDIPRNYKEAAKWYLKAGEKGDPKAMNMLGIIYRHGYGVKRDDEEAVKWDRKGAQAGSPHAKVNLGTMLLIGRGVQRNPVEGVKWLREGADYGLSEGQLRLGQAYEKGDGVEQSYLEAYKWYLKAALQEDGSMSNDANYHIG
jgi:hypothetical protein